MILTKWKPFFLSLCHITYTFLLILITCNFLIITRTQEKKIIWKLLIGKEELYYNLFFFCQLR